jgi:RNA binding exosome subunit
VKEFPFASASISAHVHATESEEKVLGAIKLLLPEGVLVRSSNVKGHYGNPITMLGTKVEGAAVVQNLWRILFEKLPAHDVEKIRGLVPDLVDGSCRLYLRFDKQRACKGELALVEGGDAIHVKFKVLVYPAKQGAAITAVKKFLHDRPI